MRSFECLRTRWTKHADIGKWQDAEWRSASEAIHWTHGDKVRISLWERSRIAATGDAHGVSVKGHYWQPFGEQRPMVCRCEPGNVSRSGSNGDTLVDGFRPA